MVLKIATIQNVATNKRLDPLVGMPAIGSHNPRIRQAMRLTASNEKKCHVIEITLVRRILFGRRRVDIDPINRGEIQRGEELWRGSRNIRASVDQRPNANWLRNRKPMLLE